MNIIKRAASFIAAVATTFSVVVTEASETAGATMEWWRFTVKRNNNPSHAWGKAMQFSEFSLYDAVGNRVNAGTYTSVNDATDMANLLNAQSWVSAYYKVTEGGHQALDGDTATKYCAPFDGTPVMMVFRLPSGVTAVPACYSFTTANDGLPWRNPAEWTLECSADGKHWILLDSQSGDGSLPNTFFTESTRYGLDADMLDPAAWRFGDDGAVSCRVSVSSPLPFTVDGGEAATRHEIWVPQGETRTLVLGGFAGGITIPELPEGVTLRGSELTVKADKPFNLQIFYTNAWVVEPSLSKTAWSVVDDPAEVNVGEAQHGEVKVIYDGDASITVLPTTVGGHTAKFEVPESEGVMGLEKTIAYTVISGEAKLDSVTASSTAGDYTISGSITPGCGTTFVYLRWAFDSDDLVNEEKLVELQTGDDGTFSKILTAPQKGATLHWQVAYSNGCDSATGPIAYSGSTEPARQILTDSTATTWDWVGPDAGEWQTADNWSGPAVGFPNTVGSTAVFSIGGETISVELKDDVTLKELQVGGQSLTVRGEGHTFTVPTLAYKEAEGVEEPAVVLDNVKIPGTPVRPTFFGAAEKPAWLWAKNGTTVRFNGTGGSGETIASGARYRATGEGTAITFGGNATRWESGLTSDWLWLAENGATITGEGFMYVGSAADTRDVRFVALNGGTITCGAGFTRTVWHPNGVVVAATNAGTVAFGAAGGYTCNSRFTVQDANLTGNICLASNNVIRVTGDGEGLSNLGSVNYATYAKGNRVSISGGRAMAAQLAGLFGEDNEVLVEDGATVVSAVSPTFASGSSNCVLVIDNAVVTNTANLVNYKDQVGVPGCGLVFRGAAPQFIVTGDQGNLSGWFGTKTAVDDPAALTFVASGDGFPVAPLRLTKDGYIAGEYLAIRVQKKHYKRQGQYLMPLIASDTTWRSGGKPAAEAIESHLPSDALPEGAHLEWSGNTLCVRMPSAGSLVILVK